MRPISYIFDDTDLRHRRYRLGYLLSTIKAYSNEEQPKPETKALTDKARPKPLALKPAKPLRPADPPHLKASVKNDRRHRLPKTISDIHRNRKVISTMLIHDIVDAIL